MTPEELASHLKHFREVMQPVVRVLSDRTAPPQTPTNGRGGCDQHSPVFR